MGKRKIKRIKSRTPQKIAQKEKNRSHALWKWIIPMGVVATAVLGYFTLKEHPTMMPPPKRTMMLLQTIPFPIPLFLC